MKAASIARQECARRGAAMAGAAAKTVWLHPPAPAAQQEAPQRVIGFASIGAGILGCDLHVHLLSGIQSIPGQTTAPHRIKS